MLLTALEKLSPSYVAIAWDVGKKTFRTQEYAEYKAGRPETEQELVDQIERTKGIVSALNIPQFGVTNYEADDVIGTLATQALERTRELKNSRTQDGGVQVIIVTGDRDALQLVDDDKIVVYMPSGGGANKFIKDRGASLFDEEAVKAKYGLSPKQIIDLKGLMGDASDNIKGVAGVGLVTATKLLQEAPSVERIYENVDSLSVTERVKNLLRAGKESAFLSKRIATINREVPITLSWEACELSNYDREKVLALFEELAFKSLINKLPKDKWEEDLEEVFK
jgi:DNA polymerase-1